MRIAETGEGHGKLARAEPGRAELLTRLMRPKGGRRTAFAWS